MNKHNVIVNEKVQALSEFIDTLSIPIERSQIIEYPLNDFTFLRYDIKDKNYYIYSINLISGEEEYQDFDENVYNEKESILINNESFSQEDFLNFKSFVEKNSNYFNNNI